MKNIRIYTDGGCLGNPGPGGYGVVLLFGEHRKELSGGYRRTTNNRMEILAVIKGLEALKERCNVEVYSDSKYVVDALSNGWAVKWCANGWRRTKNEHALNPDLWGKLLDLCSEHKVKFHWIRGHSGDTENERCDQLAAEAANQPHLPADEPYECMLHVPMESERFPSLAGHREPFTGIVDLIKSDLVSPEDERRRKAIFRAVDEQLTELGPDLVRLMKSERIQDLKSRCAWALGKLNCRAAEPGLIDALSDRSEEVRTWAAWALGEIGNTGTEAHLRQALDRENSDNVRQAIGGALKKLNYDSTRVHESQLSKALQPPETQDPTLMALMDRLHQLDWKSDAAEIVKVRAKMKNHNADYFDSYMSWVKRRPEIIAALQDNRRVFRS